MSARDRDVAPPAERLRGEIGDANVLTDRQELPAAIGMMGALAIEAGVAAQFEQVEEHCRAAGAFEIRIAADDAERVLFWKGRKPAFAAVSRISPDYIVQGGVIPRTALPEVLRSIGTLAAERGIRVANGFHAGDGNLHPLEPARELADRKAAAVAATGADVLVTANPGCLMQIASVMRRSGRAVALAHTAEILDASIRGTPSPRAPRSQGG